ncbi:hypothetical protein AAA64_24560 [Salmonella enterica subsp. enterica serovar Dublin]|nr:hypothetical protein [Salmonella enterica subsp. enterica serovar Dublin]
MHINIIIEPRNSAITHLFLNHIDLIEKQIPSYLYVSREVEPWMVTAVGKYITINYRSAILGHLPGFFPTDKSVVSKTDIISRLNTILVNTFKLLDYDRALPINPTTTVPYACDEWRKLYKEIWDGKSKSKIKQLILENQEPLAVQIWGYLKTHHPELTEVD